MPILSINCWLVLSLTILILTGCSGSDKPECECLGTGICAGTCNEQGECVYPGADTPCLESQCTGSLLSYQVCDGAGACNPEAITQECAPYACDLSNNACYAGDCTGLDICDDNSVCGTNNSCVAPLQIVAISADQACSGVGETLSFSSEIQGEVESFSWDFGDGNYSDSQNPEHSYATPGNYTVQLTVEGPGGTDTLQIDKTLEVIKPGWNVIFPIEPIGSIVDIWRSADQTLAYAVTGDAKILRIDNFQMEVIDSPGNARLRQITGFHNSAMAIGGEMVAATTDGINWFDADPLKRLPRDDNEQERYDFKSIQMVSPNQAILAVQYEHISGHAEVQFWHYDAEAGAQDQTRLWSWLTTAGGMVPRYIQELYPVPDQCSLFFAVDIYDAVLFSIEPFEGNWRSGVVYSWFDELPYIVQAQFVNPQTFWFHNYDGINRVQWNADTQSFNIVDFTPAEWNNLDYFSINRFGISKDTRSGYQIVGIIQNTQVSPRLSILQMFSISDLLGDTPLFATIDTSALEQDYYSRIGVFNQNDILYGTPSGYLAHFSGVTWTRLNQNLVSGYTGRGALTPNNKLIIPTSGYSSQIVSRQNGNWDYFDVSSLSAERSVEVDNVFVLSDDEAWAFGYYTLLHFQQGVWEMVDLPATMTLEHIWGTSNTNMWLIGMDNGQRAILYKLGDNIWLHDEDLESKLPSYGPRMFGSGPNDIYAIGTTYGEFFHYDGERWSRVEDELFELNTVLVDNLRRCFYPSDENFTQIRDACFGTAPQFMVGEALPNGEVFGGVATIEFSWVNACGEGGGVCDSKIIVDAEQHLGYKLVHYNGTDWQPLDYYRDDMYISSIKAIDNENVIMLTRVYDDDLDSPNEISHWDGSQWTVLEHRPPGHAYHLFGNNLRRLYTTEIFSNFIYEYQGCGN
jgi:PKD repeat protein